MTDFYELIAMAVALSIIIGAMFASIFESRKAGAKAFFVCIVIFAGLLLWYWENVYEDAIMQDKVEITDLREGIPNEDVVFYNASSESIPIL